MTKKVVIELLKDLIEDYKNENFIEVSHLLAKQIVEKLEEDDK